MPRRTESMPSKGAIYKYWEKYIEENWYHPVDRSNLSLEHPICFICKRKSYTKTNSSKRYTRWNNATSLERHHIVPYALGGSNSIENLFLVCRYCHGLCPTNTDRTTFLKWASLQSYEAQRVGEFYTTINTMLTPSGVVLFDKWHVDFIKNKNNEYRVLYEECLCTTISHFDGQSSYCPTSNLALKLLELCKKEIDF